MQLTFDNVHFFRDNPNVPSDLEMMPNLLNFFESNGTFLSNSHTPLIAHTADDILTTNTGLYGDRQGMPVSNSYQAYNTDGPNGSFNTTDPASSFAYWTDPVFDTAKTAERRPTTPTRTWSTRRCRRPPPRSPSRRTRSPRRRGCRSPGPAATWATCPRRTRSWRTHAVDIPKVFGANSPEVQQLAADPDSFKDAETADYVGVAVHCALGNAFCATAQGDRGNQTTPSATAAADVLPNEPGGYSGFQALFGHRYIAPQLGAGTPNMTNGNGYQVTNAAGNLVDENGNQINGAFLTNHPGFPGFSSINASQSLAYMADMLESGVPVVNGYISDIHGNENIPGLAAVQGRAGRARQRQRLLRRPGAVLQPGLRHLLPAAGRGRHHPVEHAVRAELRRGRPRGGRQRRAGPSSPPRPTATARPSPATPSPPTCRAPTRPGSFGELAGNMTGLLATQKSNTTPFSLEADTAPEFYVTGDPGPNAPAVRTLERDVAGLTADNPYAGGTQPITNYLADPAEEAILHMVNADPARTPTFAMFAKPDYFLSAQAAPTCSPCVTQNTGFA